jgi:cellulase/cellobiase CelA1
MVRQFLSARRHAGRGQGGFVVITALAVWLLVGGAVMIALLNMTLSVSNQARLQAESAQEARSIDGALETAVTQIQIDPSGRIGQPTGKDDGSCEAGLTNSGDELVVDDGLGNSVAVTATCSGSTKKGETHQVDLTARLDGSTAVAGSAVLDVVKAKGPGNNVTVVSWSVGLAAADGGSDTTTTTPSSTTTTTVPITTSTTTPTTTSTTPTGVSWSSRVTSEWESGYCVEVTVTNKAKNTEKWTVQVPVKGTIYAFWSAKYTRSGDTLTVTGESWNQSLKSGESTTFGWCSNF